MSVWPEIKVAQLISDGVIALNDGYRVTNKELGVTGTPFVRGGDIGHRGEIYTEVADHVLPEFSNRIFSKLTKPGDVAFITKGTVGRTGFLRDGQPPVVFAPQVCYWRSLKPEILSPRFLFYLLSSGYFQRNLDAVKTHGSMAADYVSLSDQKSFQLPLPPAKTQRAIAEVLGALDDKIELNVKMNAIFEQMARRSFKSWFIDFDPVRAKLDGKKPFGMDDATATHFPDSFEKSEMGEIPKGWLPRTVGEIATLSGGKQLERELIAPDGATPVFGGAGIMGFTSDYNADGFVISIGRVGAYCGQFFAYRGKAWINNNASLIKPNDEQIAEWLFLSLKHVNIDVIKKGAAQPFVSNGDIANLKIVWPGDQVVTSFSSQIVPLLNALAANDAESKTLAQIRDLLLPRLLSGEITIKDMS